MVAVIFVSMGQSVYAQVMPLIGRELGFSVKLITTFVSISAFMFLITTPYWGRMSDRKGRKFVLMIGFIGYVISSLLFILVAYLGMIGILMTTNLILFFLLARILNSAVGAASRPAAGAYIADITTEEERSAGMGQYGAANNLGTIFAPIMVGFIAFLIANTSIFPSYLEPYGRLIPVLIMSLLSLLAMLMVYFYLPETLEKGVTEERAQKLAYDSKLFILVGIGVLIFICFSSTMTVAAFYIQDKFNFTTLITQERQGIAFGLLGLFSIIVQLSFIQKSKMIPINFVLISIPFFILGVLSIVMSPSFIYFVLGMSFLGIAMGLASSGYTATASLNAGSSNQGEAVGIAMVAPGLGFAIGPLMSGFLYEVSPNLPYLVCIPIFLLIFILVLFLKRYI
ncbi:MAG: MFS transporter [Gammaproteobacteria bacterium]